MGAREITAALVAQLGSDQDARTFWQPILDLGPGAHYWISDFFNEWLLRGEQFAPSLQTFATLCREIVEYTFDAPNWIGSASAGFRLEDCSLDSMGLGLTQSIVGAEEFLPVIESLAPLFERWGARWLSHARPASNFGYFLSRAAGRALLPQGIVWLNRGIQNMSKYGWDERGLPDALAGALRTCWRHHQQDVVADASLQEDFLQLLNTLCNRLVKDALSLRAEVSQFVSG